MTSLQNLGRPYKAEVLEHGKSMYPDAARFNVIMRTNNLERLDCSILYIVIISNSGRSPNFLRVFRGLGV